MANPYNLESEMEAGGPEEQDIEENEARSKGNNYGTYPTQPHQQPIRPLTREEGRRAVEIMEQINKENAACRAAEKFGLYQVVRIDPDGTRQTLAGIGGCAKLDAIRQMDEAAKDTGYRYEAGELLVVAMGEG